MFISLTWGQVIVVTCPLKVNGKTQMPQILIQNRPSNSLRIMLNLAIVDDIGATLHMRPLKGHLRSYNDVMRSNTFLLITFDWI